jgi:hypothetical protein
MEVFHLPTTAADSQQKDGNLFVSRQSSYHVLGRFILQPGLKYAIP